MNSFNEAAWQLLVPLHSTPQRDRPLVRSDEPAVDVIVATCGEDLDIILDTVKATCALDYPRDKYRVIVADDGNDKTLQHKIKKLAQQHRNLHYFARVKSLTKHGYKAGNLNDAIVHAQSLRGEQAQWIGGLDSDMIPSPLWLRTLLAYAEPGVGMIQAPQVHVPKFASVPFQLTPLQRYYNLPAGEPLYQSRAVHETHVEPLRSTIDCAWCTGTGWVARPEALASIGGFAQDSICEDILSGYLLVGQGWRLIHVSEGLQTGLMPDSLGLHLKQRTKWVSRDAETLYRWALLNLARLSEQCKTD